MISAAAVYKCEKTLPDAGSEKKLFVFEKIYICWSQNITTHHVNKWLVFMCDGYSELAG